MNYKYENNTKLRIVLLLDKKTNSFVKKLNKEIGKDIPSDIIFSKKCLPHITLVSGVLKNSSDFEKVCEIVENEIVNNFTKNLKIGFDEFYFSSNKNWLFLGLKDNKELTNFISNLREKLNEFFEISDARRLHITLAKSNELISKQECICDLKIPNDCNFENIAIGLSGKNGILENTIKKFKINNFHSVKSFDTSF